MFGLHRAMAWRTSKLNLGGIDSSFGLVSLMVLCENGSWRHQPWTQWPQTNYPSCVGLYARRIRSTASTASVAPNSSIAMRLAILRVRSAT